jgi:hypothetical protein
VFSAFCPVPEAACGRFCGSGGAVLYDGIDVQGGSRTEEDKICDAVLLL